MDKSIIIAKLREHESELKAAGVEHLFLHGSYARGIAILDVSDVDVIAEFAPGRRLSLLDMVAIENRLTDILGVRVDLSPAKSLKEPVAARASREAVLAFYRTHTFPRDILDGVDMFVQFVRGMAPQSSGSICSSARRPRKLAPASL